jgi:hypothetical protein
VVGALFVINLYEPVIYHYLFFENQVQNTWGIFFPWLSRPRFSALAALCLMSSIFLAPLPRLHSLNRTRVGLKALGNVQSLSMPSLLIPSTTRNQK